MEISGKHILMKGAKAYPAARSVIQRWVRITEAAKWSNFLDVKAQFPAVDYIPSNTFCFDIGGNSYRLLTAISFKLGTVQVLEFLTNADYDKRRLGR